MNCDNGRIVRANGMTEACNSCRAHELVWAAYYAEQLRLWLLKKARS